MATLGKQAILAALAPQEERLELWGHTLVIRELASAADVVRVEDDDNLTYHFIVRCTFDEAGEPLFTDDDIPQLKACSKAKLLPIIEAVSRVNGLWVNGNAKNSEAAPCSG